MPFQNIFLSNIVIHRHPELVADYGLAGYHHADGEKLRKCKGTCSRSIHSVDDLSSLENDWICFFWASLQIYLEKRLRAKSCLTENQRVLTDISKNKNRPKVYALGGIRRKKIIALSEVRFRWVCFAGFNLGA